MDNYSEEQQEEFEELHKKILDIEKNIEDGLYNGLAYREKAESIENAFKDMSKYFKKVPGDLQKISKFKMNRLSGRLIKIKNEI